MTVMKYIGCRYLFPIVVLGTVTIGDCMDRMAEIILRWWQRTKELVF